PGSGGTESGQGGAGVLQVLLASLAHHQRHPLGLRARPPHQLGDLADEAGGEVVDHEPAQVLQGVGRGRTPRAGQPADDEEVAHGWPIFSALRNSRRGMVAAASYSWARARKPGGGAGSSMRVTRRPLAARALRYLERGRWTKGMRTP